MVALDGREPLVAAAADQECQLLLTHHPPIFPTVASITGYSAGGRFIQAAIEAGVAVVAAHTNLDAVPGGLNDHLARAAGLRAARPLVENPRHPGAGIGRVGSVATVTVGELAARVARHVGLPGLSFTGEPARLVRRVACCTGSGGGLIDAARAAGADVFITGDLKYHDADRADGMALVNAPHAATEDWALRQWFPALEAALAADGVRAVVAGQNTDPWGRSRVTL